MEADATGQARPREPAVEWEQLHFHDEVTLVLLAVRGAIVYALAILVLFGRSRLLSLVRG